MPFEITGRFRDTTGVCHHAGDVQLDASYDGDRVAYYTPGEARQIAAAIVVAADEAEKWRAFAERSNAEAAKWRAELEGKS